ncbi:MAG: hypothetical protein JJLCMIEE_00944 [Acidimicrobiales bacterium]|nr:MAG: hypothetical protein EDR02_11215 [Actinomycetota bacterium]MBV6507886.1 hypothetical protein [Acidimicrobiales bacterium]RIK06030.1 MAG: hypothetical protein DCC48_08755 [Acidobacteriota bacterium]
MLVSKRLAVTFLDEEHTLYPGAGLTFGRMADLVIDDNRYLHRHLGRFVFHDDMWWLENLGSAIPIKVVNSETASSVTVNSGDKIPLTFPHASIRFNAGPAAYELTTWIEGLGLGVATDDADAGIEALDAEQTVSYGEVPLTDEQRLLIVALCEQRLRDPGFPELLPTNRELAERLGWSVKKFNRKLDNVCDKLRRAGVSNLHGGSAGSAYDRRRVLIAHAIVTQLVTGDDLELLDGQ